jgi:hypothetical protein
MTTGQFAQNALPWMRNSNSNEHSRYKVNASEAAMSVIIFV